MVVNISVQYNGGFLPDIILLTQGYYQWGTRLNTCSGFVLTAFVMYITTTMCDGVLHRLCFVSQAPILVWFDGTIIDISTILLTMYYYYSGYVGL